MLLNDVPYLQPLLMWLRNDESLKSHFTESSFFMPHHDLVSAILDKNNPDCPLPKSLWIIPGDTEAIQRLTGCKSTGLHSFTIAIAVKCIRDSFVLVNRGGEIELEGQFMELSRVRSLVKKSVHKFSLSIMNKYDIGFSEITWVDDKNLYPNEENQSLLASASEFQVKILN